MSVRAGQPSAEEDEDGTSSRDVAATTLRILACTPSGWIDLRSFYNVK